MVVYPKISVFQNFPHDLPDFTFFQGFCRDKLETGLGKQLYLLSGQPEKPKERKYKSCFQNEKLSTTFLSI